MRSRHPTHGHDRSLHGASKAEDAYNEHMKTYGPHADKSWYRKASALAMKVGGPLHDHLAHYHYKDSGGKASGWAAWREKNEKG